MLKEDLLKAAGKMFDVHPRDITGPSRFEFLLPVRFALYKALSLRGWTQARIGTFMNRDRSSVRYGIARAEHMMERDENFAVKVSMLAVMKPEQIITVTEKEQEKEEVDD